VELRELIGLGGFVVLFILLVVRAPVGLAMVAVGIGGNFALSLAVPHLRFEPFLRQFKSLLWNVVANYDLSVVPLFVLMGLLASHANLSRDLFRGLNAIVGRFRGGVAMAAIGACAGFGAVCGSSLATASTMGRVALPELRRLNYSPSLATGALAAGGTLGILIPPSVALVVYAVVVEASIVKLFQAAVIPGLLATLFFILVIAIQVRIKPALAPQIEKQDSDERRVALLRFIPVGVIFGAIILGLGFGLFTPTPAAAVGVFVILAYGLLQRLWGEGLTAGGIKDALLDSSVTSGMIYFILFGAEVLKSFFARSGLPAAMAEWAVNSGIEPFMLLAGILVVLIILGCFLESLSMILVIVPFLWPILVQVNGGEFVDAAHAGYGLDQESLRIWFGILALIVVELGLITPPVGLNVFIISSLSQGVPMSQTFKGVMPFFAAEIVRVSIIVAFPALSLFLPWLLSGGP
jgi:tripartite ATP-independent transporter DctM subunit